VNDIIGWLIDVELSAHKVYSEGISYFIDNPNLSKFLHIMSEDETFHYQVMKNLDDLSSNGKIEFTPVIKLDDSIKSKVKHPFDVCSEKLNKKSLTENDMYDCLVNAEFSEWNDIFIYVINSLSKQKLALQAIPSKMQKHLAKLEYFFNSDDKLKIYFRGLKDIPKIWNFKILIIDDEKPIRDLLMALFKLKYYSIEFAENGDDAFKLCENNYYDVMICDINMPLMNGIEFYNKIKTLEYFDSESIIFVSGNLEFNSFLKDHNLKFILKPFYIQTMLDEVDKIITKVS
jgi:CheY-like chemotaxis protein